MTREEAFEKYGPALQKCGEAFRDMQSETAKVAFALDQFGRAAHELMPILKEEENMTEPIVTTQLTPKKIKLVMGTGVLLFVIGGVIMIAVAESRIIGAEIAAAGAIVYIGARIWAWWKVG